MSTPRRDFLKSALMSAAAVAIVSQSARFAFGQKKELMKDGQGYFQIPEQVAANPVFHFTRATFEPYLESDFLVTVGPYKSVNLTLVKVEDRRPRQRKGMLRMQGECFLLSFKANGKLSDLQQTYVLQHAALGKFSLFLVDASEEGKGYYYSAVINHARPTDGRSKD